MRARIKRTSRSNGHSGSFAGEPLENRAAGQGDVKYPAKSWTQLSTLRSGNVRGKGRDGVPRCQAGSLASYRSHSPCISQGFRRSRHSQMMPANWGHFPTSPEPIRNEALRWPAPPIMFVERSISFGYEFPRQSDFDF
jgi:hypothetical protein